MAATRIAIRTAAPLMEPPIMAPVLVPLVSASGALVLVGGAIGVPSVVLDVGFGGSVVDNDEDGVVAVVVD